MSFAPIDLMLTRVQKAGSASDTVLFLELLYAGEFIVKMTTAAFAAAVEDDREGHRYRSIHALVRADGLGEWARAMEEMIAGTTSQHIVTEAKQDRRIFTERVGSEAWQHEAVTSIWRVLNGITHSAQPLGEKIALRSWFTIFTELRNKTRGHGAPTAAVSSRFCSDLNTSVQ